MIAAITCWPRCHLIRRDEADAATMLKTHGFAQHPGPQIHVAPWTLDVIIQALKGPHVPTDTYPEEPSRRSVLLGPRRDLAAREQGRDGQMRHHPLGRQASTFFANQPF